MKMSSHLLSTKSRTSKCLQSNEMLPFQLSYLLPAPPPRMHTHTHTHTHTQTHTHTHTLNTYYSLLLLLPLCCLHITLFHFVVTDEHRFCMVPFLLCCT